MLRALVLAIACTLALSAATIRLYLKDGTWHNVREYQKTGDRVRYYSTERSDWEEIPLALVDLKKTEAEIEERKTSRAEEAKLIDAEEKAERAQLRVVEQIPYETGVFQIEGEKVTTLKQAESKMVTNRRRSVLKAIAPIPIVSGKATVELDGPKSLYVVSTDRPEFYVRLAAEERFGLVKLTPTRTSRVVQKWNIIPVTNEIVEETNVIETFKQQIGELIYKLWPMKPLEPGEYAIVEYTEGKGNIQVWDFSYTR